MKKKETIETKSKVEWRLRMTLTNDKEITSDEAKLYDRQIRLWGVNAQKSLRKANILLIGLSGSGSEIAKNLILSGIHSIVIIEDKKITQSDAYSNLFTRNQIGENRALASEQNLKALNPMVKIEIKEWNIIEQLNDPVNSELIDLLKTVNVVCLNNFDSVTISKLDNLIRTIKGTNDTKFYATGNWGYYAYSFTDLGTNYKYFIEDVEKSNQVDLCNESSRKRIKTEDTREKKKLMVEKILDFVSFDQMLASRGNKPGSGLTKRTNSAFLLMHVMFEFHKRFQRYPELRTQEQDQQELSNLANEMIDSLHLDKKLLDKLNVDDCWGNIFGEISPITAILGGVVGQEIIRSITVQDHPIRNLFLFNGFQCSGSIENIGR